ncbi:MAG: hypothetical protein K9W46_12800 [Candidatus Heimdallarchaeum endolithica]|uniref:Uncharacterized protein n=1 Tax=Candidatus Heimdallarchaeum endolithica TaxID=2876572 RepID=A0A9Y1BQA0_9ARCH|nr:MAG: hypothetical protein K9W46_12800 [Candidatus Heimdallarchaeum endolithica]
MEESSKVPVSGIKASLVYPESKIKPVFNFENMIVEHYKRFPRTAALIENPKYAKALMNPLKSFYLVPIAIFKVKFNTILSMKFWNYMSLWLYILIASIPNSISMYLTFKSNKILGDITFSVIIPILVSSLVALWYLKFTHDGFFGLIIEKKVEWLEKPVKEYYDKYYDKKFSLNVVLVTLSVLTSLGVGIPVLIYASSQGLQSAIIFGIIGMICNLLVFYVFYLSLQYTILNTKIYSKVLNTIKNRINLYLNEYGTLLNSENYEIIWALGDTPGRSIRQLENIPIAGVISALIVTIAMLIGTINQAVLGLVKGVMPTVNIINSQMSLNAIIATISLVIAIVMVLIVILPLYIFSSKMKKFKVKALIELDNYIFANVMEFEQRYSELAKQETVTIFALREYISGMRTIPISAAKIIKSLTAVAVWFVNVRKIIKAFG